MSALLPHRLRSRIYIRSLAGLSQIEQHRATSHFLQTPRAENRRGLASPPDRVFFKHINNY
nr:MAG TPA: hypothetical protein [Caudoviricetes sp.]